MKKSPIFLLTYKRLAYANVNTHKNTFGNMFYAFRDNEIYCIFKLRCIISVLFTTKYPLFHNVILLCSDNTFFINSSLKLKYQLCHLKFNIIIYCSVSLKHILKYVYVKLSSSLYKNDVE